MCQGPIHSQSNRITMQFRLLSICNKSDFQCSMTLNVSRSDLFPSTVIHHYIFLGKDLGSPHCVYMSHCHSVHLQRNLPTSSECCLLWPLSICLLYKAMGFIIIFSSNNVIFFGLGRWLSSQSICNSSKYFQVQICRIHVDIRWVWWLPDNSSLEIRR